MLFVKFLHKEKCSHDTLNDSLTINYGKFERKSKLKAKINNILICVLELFSFFFFFNY
jgi:hypothetical protein